MKNQYMKLLPTALFLLCSSSLFAANGASIYSQQCASCHGKDGKTSALRATGQIAGIKKPDLMAVLQKYKNGTLDKYGSGIVMTAATSKLSNAELEAASQYISELR